MNKARTGHRRTTAGFSLPELAIALVIVGLLIGLFAPSLSATLERRKLAETRQALEEAREALLGFAVMHRRLPRPAVSFSRGEERSACDPGPPTCAGFLPWQTLGVRRSDGWNKLLHYSVTTALANGTPISLEIVPPSETAPVGRLKIRSRRDDGTLFYLVGSDDSCSRSPCAAAVIHSAGAKHWGTLENGVEVGDGSATNTDEDTNAATGTIFIARPPGQVPEGGEFDDVVIWLPLPLLVNRLVAAGRLP